MWSRVVMVSSLGCVTICWGLIYTVQVTIIRFLFNFNSDLQAPFFPHVALAKGVTASQFSGVLGMVHLGIILSAPLAGTQHSVN